jgi:hypothetical protein
VLLLLEDFSRDSIIITAADPVAFVAVFFSDALDELTAGAVLEAT